MDTPIILIFGIASGYSSVLVLALYLKSNTFLCFTIGLNYFALFQL